MGSPVMHGKKHSLGSTLDHNPGTLAEVNALVSDATLDDSGDPRDPTNHAGEHVDGTDDIQIATDSQKGLASAAQIAKLDGIAPGATDYDDADAVAAVTSAGFSKNIDGTIDNCGTLFFVQGPGTFVIRYPVGTEERVTAQHTGTTSPGKWVRQLKLPDDFSSFKTNGFVALTRRAGATTSLTATLKKDSVADSTINASNVRPTADLTYETFQFSPGSAYAAGDVLVIEIESNPGLTPRNQLCGVLLRYNKKVV